MGVPCQLDNGGRIQNPVLWAPHKCRRGPTSSLNRAPATPPRPPHTGRPPRTRPQPAARPNTLATRLVGRS
eukprot:9215422-Lingulodinium_polyedra.AAC.1